MIAVGYVVGLIGLWVASDGILSWTLYLNAPSYEGSPKQTFVKDHWIRLIRIICGGVLVWLGYAILRFCYTVLTL